MITFPQDFTATKYPGYFWNIKEEELYSVKIGGVLKPLKRKDVWQIKQFSPYGWRIDADNWVYRVSVQGKRKYLSDKYLLSLEIEDSEFPIKD